MNMDRRTVITIVLSVVIFSAYNYYLQLKYPDYFVPKPQVTELEPVAVEETSQTNPKDQTASSSQNPTTSSASKLEKQAEGAAPVETIERLSADQLVFDTEKRVIRFDQDRSAITSIQLKDYLGDMKNRQPAELLDSPMVIQAITDPLEKMGDKGFKARREGQTLFFERQDGPFLLKQAFTIPQEGYEISVQTSFTNTSGQTQDLTAGLLVFQSILFAEEGGGFGPAAFVAQQKNFIYGLEETREEENATSYCDEPEGPVFTIRNEKLDFIGYDQHYFLTVLAPDQAKLNFDFEKIEGAGSASYCPMSLRAYQKYGIIEPGQTVNINYHGYFGPKDVDVLAKANPTLKETINFGFFGIIAKPLLFAVKWIYEFVGNYGIAIMLVTLVLKILFFPLTRAAAVSMKRMQKLQPEMTKLREKYKEDPQRQQKELMAFMSKNKVNPAKGCLPILPQIPVFFAFYNVLGQAIELRHAPFFGWIQDLSSADPYYITPILLGVGMFFQQKLTPNPSLDKNQEKIMLMMPLIFTVMMLSLPAGMVLYMIVNTLVSIIQQQWLNKRLDRELS